MTNRDDSKPLSTHPCISVYSKNTLNFVPVYTEEKADNFFVNNIVRPGQIIIGPQIFSTGWLRAGKEINLLDMDPSLANNKEAAFSSDIAIKSFLIEASDEYLVINVAPIAGGGYKLQGFKQNDKNIVFDMVSKLRIFKEEQNAPRFCAVRDLFAARVRFDVRGNLDMNNFTIRIDESPVKFKGVQFVSDERTLIPTNEIVKDLLAGAKLVGYELAATFTIEERIS